MEQSWLYCQFYLIRWNLISDIFSAAGCIIKAPHRTSLTSGFLIIFLGMKLLSYRISFLSMLLWGWCFKSGRHKQLQPWHGHFTAGCCLSPLPLSQLPSTVLPFLLLWRWHYLTLENFPAIELLWIMFVYRWCLWKPGGNLLTAVGTIATRKIIVHKYHWLNGSLPSHNSLAEQVTWGWEGISITWRLNQPVCFQGVCSCWVAWHWAGWGHCQGKLMGSLMQVGRWDNHGELAGLKAWKSTAAMLAAPTQKSKDWWIKYVPLSFWNLSKGQACDMDWAHQFAPEMVDSACMENLITFPAWAPWLIAVYGNLSKYCLDWWQSMEKSFLQPRRRKESVEPKSFFWMHCCPKFSCFSWP